MFMEQELKPCPFCGRNPYVTPSMPNEFQDVICQTEGCALQSQSFNIKEWNTRTIVVEQCSFCGIKLDKKNFPNVVYSINQAPFCSENCRIRESSLIKRV